MAQDITNENQSISYTNLDFSAIYTEVMDLIKQLTYRWDPSISDESDPGVVLVKLSALLADKCNYNIDKNVLETFPLSVTQNGNARQLYDQLGYYMNWYESAYVPIQLSWIGETTDGVTSYTIPKFTAITDSESSHVYSLIGAEGEDGIIVSNTILPTDGNAVIVIAMEGTPVQYQFENENVITAQMVDPISRRLYFPHSYISQNGVFIKNTGQENYASWTRVNNLYENSARELRYVFGYDSSTDACFLEFPDNYSELFGNGIEITYLVIPQETSNIPAQSLSQFLAPISVTEDGGVVLDSGNVKITNFTEATGHKDIESIDDAYTNYKRTVGTFNTLITLRDYLNYIRSQELDICSNAFVCDRTNDIQSTYRIMSNQHDLDTIVVKVEQLVDKTKIDSTFDYKFVKSQDSSIVTDKKYYEIENDTVVEVNTAGSSASPKDMGWYELDSIEPKSRDALSPFSLKFYLLRKAIALNSKTAYNQTFSMLKPYPDFDSLLGDTSHLEHVYEPLLPLGENTYVKSEDTTWEGNKSYWFYDEDLDTYSLITDTDYYDTTPAEMPNVYNIDVEALLPHTIMFKAVYPLVVNISTFNVLDEDTQANISSNIIRSLYSNVNSAEIEFGLPISMDYLIEVIKNSDDRIKNISIEPINYSLYATYYDEKENLYIDVELDDDMDSYDPVDPRSIEYIISALMKKDIVCKSILAGTTQLLVPDDTFIYHLSQKYLDYVEEISNITGEAVIDIRNDSVTSYTLSDTNSKIRKSYTLKDNEMVSLYRPKFNATKTFPNNIHFEYLLYNNIVADSSYKLTNGETFILYNPIKDSDNTTITGYTVYACGAGAVIHSTFDISAQSQLSALSNFARAQVLTYFDVHPTQTYYEFSTYNENYKTEIRNSSSIINNVISGTNEIDIEEAAVINIDRNDKYKFFWILSEPTYSNDSNLKSYVLFDNYDSETELNDYAAINTYTLRDGEYLFYTNEEGTDFQVLNPGTTIIRNCGVESSIYTPVENSLYYVSVEDISQVLDDAEFIFDDENNVIKPFSNGLYEVESATEKSDVKNPYESNLYISIEKEVEEDGTIQTYSIYRPTTDVVSQEGVSYYDVEFVRSSDTLADADKQYYVLVMRKQSGWCIKTTIVDDDENEADAYVADELSTDCFKEIDLYTSVGDSEYTLPNLSQLNLYEAMSVNNNKYVDVYPINSTAKATGHNRFASTEDTSIITRHILTDTIYNGIDLTNILTYTSIDMNNLNNATPTSLKLLSPVYKKYYRDNTWTDEAEVNYLSNPHEEELYAKDSSEITEDTTPEVVAVTKPNELQLFTEVDSIFNDNLYDSGCYYRASAINNVYFYDDLSNRLLTQQFKDIDNYSVSYLDGGRVLDEYMGGYNKSPLTTLYELFTRTPAIDGTVSDDRLYRISNSWSDNVSYHRPYTRVSNIFDPSQRYNYGEIVKYRENDSDPYVYYKCTVEKSEPSSSPNTNNWKIVDIAWAVYKFKRGDAPFTYDQETGVIDIPSGFDATGKYIRVRSSSIIDKSYIVENIYPAFEHDNSSGNNNYFYIPAKYLSNNFNNTADLVIDSYDDNYYYYVFDTNSNDTPKFEFLDSDNKLELLFYNNQNDIANYGVVHIFLLPRLYKFYDFVRYTYKKYYAPKEFYNRNCGEIPAWSCTALDMDLIFKNPEKNIGDLWSSLQTNTSLTLIQNEIQSFATGDILIFETDETSESYVKWPVFSNAETVLDLDSYSVSYQKVGQNIQSISKVDVDDYKWKGYSSLVLNTSNTSGQKLNYNHSLYLYNTNISYEPIKVLNGSASSTTAFQLKYPVENKKGTFIDVSTVNVLGENIFNTLYAFTPLSDGSYYVYNTNNYSTYLYFNKDETEDSGGNITYSPSKISLPIGLPEGNYLLGMNMKDDIVLTINRIDNIEGTSSSGSGVSCNLKASAKPSEIIYGDMEYTFDNENYSNYLYSYVDESRYEFTGDKYDYISLTMSNSFQKIKLPSLITYMFNKSPYDLGWYIRDDDEFNPVDSSYSGIGSGLLEIVSDTVDKNPKLEGWYEKDEITNNFKLTEDESADPDKVYYKEKDFYASVADVSSTLEFEITDSSKPITYTILDVFKYEPNEMLGDEFDTIREKIKRLDVDEEFNYMFKPSSNDLIENPLNAKEFFNSNHVYNSFVIPQLNFDELTCKYITTKRTR